MEQRETCRVYESPTTMEIHLAFKGRYKLARSLTERIRRDQGRATLSKFRQTRRFKEVFMVISTDPPFAKLEPHLLAVFEGYEKYDLHDGGRCVITDENGHQREVDLEDPMQMDPALSLFEGSFGGIQNSKTQIMERVPPPESRTKDEATPKEVMATVNLKKLRKLVGLTQEELAMKVGIGSTSLHSYESRDNMYISTLRRLISGLGGSLELLVHLPTGDFRINQFERTDLRRSSTIARAY